MKMLRVGALGMLLCGSCFAQGSADPAQWPVAGRDAAGTYYSPLGRINDGNVGTLGFAWEYQTGTFRGLEATPIVVDGTMYTSGNWGVVYALDAATGKALWTFDPKNDGQVGRFTCCDVVNRGVAVWQGRVYVASLDGRLIALDARDGKPVWSVDTLIDHKQPYSVTGLPQIAGGVVVIGNSGADMGKGGVRGYVTAYDLASGEQRWRFFTVPSRSDPQPDAAMKAALWSWDAKSDPRGGTAWAGMSYDPELNFVYIGTGNASPYQERGRNPSGAHGDDLYACSIIALDAATGKLAWYYQTTPGDNLDQDADAPFVQATLKVGGQPRNVLMQAAKNGFFYVLDRKTGELISGKPYTYVNWATGLDARGRPVLTKTANYREQPQLIYPNYNGGHSWIPMSYSAQTHLVYIPVIDAPMVWVDLYNKPIQYVEGTFAVGGFPMDKTYDPQGLEPSFGKLPAFKDGRGPRHITHNLLRAWDPIRQTTVWEHETSRDYLVYDGGVLSTGGNLVLQGGIDGSFNAYAADTGRVLKKLQTGVGTMAAPMTYEVAGVQYVAVMQGYGGGAIGSEFPPYSAGAHYMNEGRILALRLGGGAVPLPPPQPKVVFQRPPPRAGSAADIDRGASLYTTHCARCHVFGVGPLPDLRRIPPDVSNIFDDIVLHGRLAPLGMGRFDDLLSPADVADIHDYLIGEAWKGFEAQRAAAAAGGGAGAGASASARPH
jgi:quinohemoprotein ethanol dehydrogenase